MKRWQRQKTPWKDVQVRRQKDLKVIVMSATLDAVKFADFFRAGRIVHVMVQPSSNPLPNNLML